MEFVYGLLTAAVFFCCLLLFFYLGIQYAKKKPPDKPAIKSENELSDDEFEWVKRQKKIQRDFVKLMDYDVSQALQGKKVT